MKTTRKSTRKVCTFHGEQYAVTVVKMESSVMGKIACSRYEILTGPAKGYAGGGRDIRKESVHKAARMIIKKYAAKEA